jgi:5-methyltetrahydrofolate--homocysteine methyltransferase
MNRIFIESHGLGVDPAEVNAAGIRLARQAAGRKGYVLGDLSATGKLLEPYGECSEHELYQTYREQAGFLADAGADGFIIETMLDLREALCALRGCRAAADLPVMVSMSFSTVEKGGRTIMGNSAEDCARELTQAGAFAVGANCGDLDPAQTAVVVSLLHAATSLPVLAQPNAGKPRLAEGRTVFDMPPADFALGIAECLRAGANLVGGCCGTTPEHMKAVAGLNR